MTIGGDGGLKFQEGNSWFINDNGKLLRNNEIQVTN